MFGVLAQLLAWCYSVVPNYGVTITFFTLIVMVAVTPLTVKGMRSMAEMARLQPQMKRLQDEYKNDRVKMNEEMQALFKEHKVNPLGGCLPTLLPLPIFFIIFRLLRGLAAKHSSHLFNPLRLVNGLPNPHYIPHASSLYQHLVADGGKMVSFGMDLGKSARDSHGSVGAALPFYALIVVMTVSQYVQQQQMNKRNPQAAAANPQMKITMQLFPAFYAVISLTIPASVVLYLLVSGLYRMVQNILSYTYDPKMALPPLVPGAIEAASRPSGGRKNGSGDKPALAGGGGGLFARARAAAAAGSDRSTADDARALSGGAQNGAKKPAPAGAKKPASVVNKKVVNKKVADQGAADQTGADKATDRANDGTTKSGEAPKKMVNVKPPRPSSGRVTPPGAGERRPRRGR